jgi:hypothetical protein
MRSTPVPQAARSNVPLHPAALHEAPIPQLTVVRRAKPARQSGTTIIVQRSSRYSVQHGTCALCWVGPGPLAGIVRRDTASAAENRAICSRCLVTLEMLAVQFGFQLRLQVETPA